MEVLCFRLPGHGDATLQSMNSLRTKKHFCDITIIASDQKTFRGHKVVLAACSPFLRDQFLLNPSSELQVSVLHSSGVVCQLLQSCYTGILQFSPKEIVNYLTAASYLQMEHVVEKCRKALSQYLQPRAQSPTGTIKQEEMHSLAEFDEGDQPLRCRSPSITNDHAIEIHTQADSIKNGSPDRDDSHGKGRGAGPSGEFQEEDREDFEVFQVCIENEEEGAEDKDGDEGREGADLTMDGAYRDESLCRENSTVAAGIGREGYRIWRRPLGNQRATRGRGFSYRRRAGSRGRRSAAVTAQYQEAWRLPTAEELMGNFGLVQPAPTSYISTCGLRQGGPEQMVAAGYSMEEVQGEEPGTEEFSLGEASGNREEAESESVAVVGSTSCTLGPASCEPCGLTFPSAESLALHARSAHPLYVCPRCGKQFNHASNLNRHMSIHRGTKLHCCHLCHKTFTQKSTLCDHMNLHSGERPHRCSYCHVRFAHKPALRRHLKEQHGKTTAQNCMEAQREREREEGVM